MFSASRTHRAARRFPAANPAGGLDVPGLRAPGSSGGPGCCRAVAPQRQESVRFALVGPTPEKKDARSGPVLASRGRTKGKRYRPLGGVSAPAARASGTRISQTGGGRFWGQRRIRIRTGKTRRPGFRNSPGVSCIRWGLRNTKIDRSNGRSPIADLIHRPPAIRRRRGPLHRVHLDILETLQRVLEGAITPEWGQKRAAGPSAGANRVPPAL